MSCLPDSMCGGKRMSPAQGLTRGQTEAQVQFGFCVPIFASPGDNLFRTPGFPEIDPAAAMTLARRADQLGYDSLWVADHLMLGHDDAILEGWTVLAAKMAATLDQISGGRLIHFMDCGYMGREYTAYGFDWDDDLHTRVAKLAEATELILRIWSAEEPLTYRGEHYAVTDAVCKPHPLQPPHPPLWFGEATP